MSDKNQNSNTKDTENVKPENSKTDRLDRMEKQLELIEAGVLLCVNQILLSNSSVTPIGTHDPDVQMVAFKTLEEVVNIFLDTDE